jgi:hypothetical protein
VLPEAQVQECKKISNKILALSLAGQFLETFKFRGKTFIIRVDAGGGGIELKGWRIRIKGFPCKIFPVRE